jgi:uncharacterized SAM-binding protein YcdF (DUF218 family)
MTSAIRRGVALFLGLFTVVNIVGDLRFARANGNVWWLDLWPIPLTLTRIVLLAIGAALLLYALAPGRAIRFRQTMIYVAAIAAAIDAIRYYVALARHDIKTAWPVPLSAVIAMVLVWIARGGAERGHRAAIALAAVGAAIIFPLAQVCFFGITDYRRPADVIVVFGAKAYADGTPSDALADRVRTGCELYRAGLAPQLFLSGGPGEPRVMRGLAQQLGVPPQAIIEDPAGVNTEATVRNTARLGKTRALAVSHFYHLPRIKMTYQRYGLDVLTVPSQNTVPFSMPFNLAREDAAFWWYYVRRLA